MRVLLDENLPISLAAELVGHQVTTVSGQGWQGIKNGELLRRAQGTFEVMVTMDRNLEFQQTLSSLNLCIVLALATSNRMADLRPIVPAILQAIETAWPG
ncbi:MAG: hypothetical protein CMJ45_00615 [Planctomyces sp.]|nr:hypothetical protein [Planctomyces sp.]